MPSFFLVLIDKIYIIIKDFKDSFIYLWNFLYIKVYLLILLLVNIINFLAVYLVIGKISNSYDDIVILHYNVSFGVNLIKKAIWLYVIPLLGFIISVINVVLLVFIANHKDRKFISHLLLFTAILVNIFLFFGIIAIFLINYF